MWHNHYDLNNNRYLWKHTIHKCRLTLVVSDTNCLLISDFSSWWQEERDTILKSLWPTILCWRVECLRSLSVGIRKTQLHASMAEIQLSAYMVQSQLLNWLFFKILKFSGSSLLGMTSTTLQSHFLSGGLLWQWWLSYPLRTSVNCTNSLHTWALKPDRLKPNQTEW